jgi:glycosyltransferase A (GT-A) superfamily protein (DUF2064 family)
MQVMENEGANKRTYTREREQKHAVESISLSDPAAGARVSEIVRSRLGDGSQRVIITHAARELPLDVLEHAFEALRYSAIVCAPDGDGDIALIGMTEPHDALLAAVSWGTSDALGELLSGARSRHVPVMLLPPAGAERNGPP